MQAIQTTQPTTITADNIGQESFFNLCQLAHFTRYADPIAATQGLGLVMQVTRDDCGNITSAAIIADKVGAVSPQENYPRTPARVLNTRLLGYVRLEARLEFGRVRPRDGYRKSHQVHALATEYVVGFTDMTAQQVRSLDADHVTMPDLQRAMREFIRTGQPAAVDSHLMCAHCDPQDAIPGHHLTAADVSCKACQRAI
jgi:hypothetical protein